MWWRQRPRLCSRPLDAGSWSALARHGVRLRTRTRAHRRRVRHGARRQRGARPDGRELLRAARDRVGAARQALPAEAATAPRSTRICWRLPRRCCAGGHVTGAVRITQSVAAVHRAVRRSIAGLALIAAVVLSLGMAAGLADCAPARAAVEAPRGDRRRDRARRAGPARAGGGNARAAFARALVQRDD